MRDAVDSGWGMKRVNSYDIHMSKRTAHTHNTDNTYWNDFGKWSAKLIWKGTMQKIVENEIIEIEPQKGYDRDLDEAVAFRRQTSSNLY